MDRSNQYYSIIKIEKSPPTNPHFLHDTIVHMETLAIAKQLHKVGIDEDESYKIAEAINGKSGLATKEDLAEVKAELKEDIHVLKENIHILRSEMAEMNNNIESKATKEDIHKLELKNEKQFAEIKTSQNWIKVIGVAILVSLLGIGITLIINTSNPTPTITQIQP